MTDQDIVPITSLYDKKKTKAKAGVKSIHDSLFKFVQRQCHVTVTQHCSHYVVIHMYVLQITQTQINSVFCAKYINAVYQKNTLSYTCIRHKVNTISVTIALHLESRKMEQENKGYL